MNTGKSSARAALKTAFPFLALLALAFSQISCESSQEQYNKDGYASKFGAMARGPDGVFRVYAETTLIHKQIDESYVHGFEVRRKDKTRFMCFFEIRFPEPLDITPEMEAAYHVSEGGRVLRSQAEMKWSFYSSPFWFTKDDPLGMYQITIYIDGDEYRTINYQVVPFGNEEIEF